MNYEEKFFQIEHDIARYRKVLSQAADTIIDENVSRYPIFVIHQLELEIGIPLLQRNDDDNKWNIHASTLEEFVTKQIVANDKIDQFKTIYKDPQEFLCLFALSDAGATYIFIPR